jgi:hypothetical protein
MDDSVPDGSAAEDSAPDDCSAVPLADGRSASAPQTDDSVPDGSAAEDSAVGDCSVVQPVDDHSAPVAQLCDWLAAALLAGDHCAPAARRDDSQVGSAEDLRPDARSRRVGSAADSQADSLADLRADCPGDSQADSLLAGPVGFQVDSLPEFPADLLGAPWSVSPAFPEAPASPMLALRAH